MHELIVIVTPSFCIIDLDIVRVKLDEVLSGKCVHVVE